MSAKKVRRDEAVPETLVYIGETMRCSCACHDREGGGVMDDNCCRYPGWRPKALSLLEIMTRLRAHHLSH